MSDLNGLNFKSRFYFLPPLVAWVLSLLVYWPGMMSRDSVIEWGMVMTGQFHDSHPAFHTFLIWLLTRIWFSPAIVALFQVISLSLVVGWGCRTLEKMGVPTLWCWIASFTFALNPINWVLVITLWKDIPYSISLLALTIILLNVVRTNGEWLTKWRWLMPVGVLLCIALFRHNGITVAFLCPIALAVFIPKLIKPAFYAMVFTIMLWWGIRGPLYRALNVAPVGWTSYSLMLHQMGAHIAAGTEIPPADQKILDQILPLSTNWYYACESISSGFWNGSIEFNKEYFWVHREDFKQIYLQATLSNPEVILKHLLCSSGFVWNPLARTTKMALKTIDGFNWISSNESGLESDSRIPALVPVMSGVIKTTDFIWRPALFLYVCILAMGIALYRFRKFEIVLPFVPILLQSITMVVFSTSPEFRYQYPVVLVASLLWPLFFSRSVQKMPSQANPEK